MTTDYGKPPGTGWAKLTPELLVEDIDASLRFWTQGLGFALAYQRPEGKFVYLERPEGAQIMLCQRANVWETGPMERPFGRGVMLQVAVDDTRAVEAVLAAYPWPLHAGPREVWRRWGDREGGNREIFVLDPDGYLVMVRETLGERPLSPA